MKNVLFIAILSIFAQQAYGQACGIYRIKYTGTVINEDIEVLMVQLPSVDFLHSSKIKKPKHAYIETEVQDNKFDIITQSPITSLLFNDAESYMSIYEEKREEISIMIRFREGAKEKEFVIEIPWKDIKMTKIQDEGFGNLFEIDLKEIDLTNRL